MSLLPSVCTAIDVSLQKCSNYYYTETCTSVISDTLNFSSNDILTQEQVMSKDFRNESVLHLSTEYNSKMSKTSLDFPAQPFSGIASNRNNSKNIVCNNDGTQENVELQKFVWRCVQNQGETGSYLDGSKSFVAESNGFLQETEDAVCDKNPPVGKVFEEENPHKAIGETKSGEYQLYGFTIPAEETAKKVGDDGGETYAWLDIQQSGELDNDSKKSKSYVPGSTHHYRVTQSAVCDKSRPSGEENKRAHKKDPQETNGGIKPIKYFLDDFTTSEDKVLKIEDDGVKIAWMDVKVVHSSGGCHFNCSICYSSFNTQSEATIHLQEHGITKPFKCLWCETSSETLPEAKAHHSSHSGIMLLNCNFCDCQFSKEKVLQRHKAECPHLASLSAKHQFHINNSSVEDPGSSNDGDDASEASVTRTSFDTEELQQSFSSSEMEDNDDKNSNDCSLPSVLTLSDNSASSSQAFKENNPSKETNTEKTNSKKSQKNFQCLTCGKMFRASKPLREHEVVHTGAREFPCVICGKAFGTKANMTIHLATHSDRKPFTCNICNSKFRQKDSLKVHFRKHNGERPFPCTVCSMTFDRSFTLKNHLLTHGEERSHVCAVCGKAFTTRGGLNNHERLHFKDPSKMKARKPPSKPGTGNYICDECGKLYSTRSNLRVHQRSHEPILVTHPCYVCGRIYKHKDSLDVHMRKHTDDRPFSCHTCGRNFYRNWTLKLHQLTHTGEKPHKCPVDGCNKSFTQSSSRYNHVQNHHKQQDSLNKTSVHEADPLPSIPEDVNLRNNSMSHVNQSESMVMNAIQSTDTVPNNHAFEVAPLFLVDPQNRNPTLPDQVENLIMPSPSTLSLNTSILTGNPLTVEVGVGEVNASVLNGMSLNTQAVPMAPEIPLNPQETVEIDQHSHLDLATHHMGQPVGSLCPIDVSSSLVWDTDLLPMGLNDITTGIHLPQTHQADPPTLQTLPQPLDPSVYILPHNEPLLVGVDGHLYQQDTHLKMTSLQNNYVSQLH